MSAPFHDDMKLFDRYSDEISKTTIGLKDGELQSEDHPISSGMGSAIWVALLGVTWV
jgi:hypothetical protein